ncbi:MAG: DUF4856 domain-containing protein [Bacteroidota bacterium]
MTTITKNLFKPVALGFAISLIAISCKKDKDVVPTPTPNPVPSYAVPTTYNFANVSYTGQTQRLQMLDSISEYMKKGNSMGTALDAAKMKNMYSNTGSPFNNTNLDASGKQLKNKTYASDQTYFDGLFDDLAAASQSTTAGSDGVAGVVTVGTSKYLCNANGVEIAQVIKKQLQSAVFYYQALETYLANLPVDDNTTVNADGTAQEHHFDEAFGYFGAPTDFPTNTSGLKYCADYANKVNTAISCNATIMNAFLKCRAAISNKDYTTRDAQITIIRQQWERIAAASVIYELKASKNYFGDDAKRNHYLSEALGFIRGLKYNSNKQISQTQIDAAETALGTNFYAISTTDIDNSINTINAVYGFDLSKF